MEILKISKDISKLHQALGKRLYADEFSFISEICQNAVDSHRMSGQKKPVEVGIKARGMDWIFYVKDEGLGFESKEDFVAKICTILESGKTAAKTNDEDCPMGMHGIGSISVSKYHSNWDYTIVNNGRKFIASLQETEGVGLQHEESDYEETSEEKYTLFEVKVKNVHQLITNMKKKLCYFKDIFFVFPQALIAVNKDLLTINSTFKLLQTDDVQISTLSPNGQMHICLDQYSYPIRWEDIGMQPIPLNIGLRFGMGDGLSADITRENLNFDSNYKRIIKDKIKKVADWMVEKYNATIPDEYTNYTDAVTSYHISNKSITINNQVYSIMGLLQISSVKLKPIVFKGVSPEVFKTFMERITSVSQLLTMKYQISPSGKKLTKTAYYNHYRSINKMNSVIITAPISASIQTYIKDKMRNFFFYEKKKITLSKPKGATDDANYKFLLSLRSKPKDKWRTLIKQFQILEEAMIEANVKNSKTIKIPEDYNLAVKKVANKKAKVSVEDLQGEIGVKYAQKPLAYGSGWECKFVEKIIQVKDLSKTPHLHIYGSEENRRKLDRLYTMTNKGIAHNIRVCIITPTQQKHIRKLKLHNFMDVEEFFKGEHETFKKLMTGYIIESLITKYQSIFSDQEMIKEFISKKFGEDLTYLQRYSKNYNAYNYLNAYSKDDSFITGLLELTHKCKLYDLQIWHVYENVKKEIDKFDFVSFFSHIYRMKPEDPIRKKGLDALDDICRQRKIRMNWENYKLLDHEA